MTKVWAASSGSYSDYRVGCLFTTRELARRYVLGIARRGWEAQEARYKELTEKYEGLPVNINARSVPWLEPPDLNADDKAWDDWCDANDGVLYGSPFVEEFDLYDALPLVES